MCEPAVSATHSAEAEQKQYLVSTLLPTDYPVSTYLPAEHPEEYPVSTRESTYEWPDVHMHIQCMRGAGCRLCTCHLVLTWVPNQSARCTVSVPISAPTSSASSTL